MAHGDNLFRKIAHFEHGLGAESQAWLGTSRGLAVGLGLLVAAGVGTVLLVALAFEVDERLVHKLCFLAWLLMAAGVGAFWRRQRLAAHFEAARRLIASTDGDERQRGFTELMINARRSWGEHGRITRVLAEYLRRPPLEQPNESGRRQLAFTMLADQTLTMRAKAALDLTGALLTGVRAPGAELPGVLLCGADLSGARLAGANLMGADLREARLDGADLKGARLDGTLRSS